MFKFFKNMFKISSVNVDRISLITKDEKPAVPHAETKFAILHKKAKKNTLNEANIQKLESINKSLDNLL